MDWKQQKSAIKNVFAEGVNGASAAPSFSLSL
jgi:hypothetical protein